MKHGDNRAGRKQTPSAKTGFCCQPWFKMKSDSPRRKKKRLNSLFEGMETKVQIKKSERENTTGSTSKGKTAADLRATKLAQANQKNNVSM